MSRRRAASPADPPPLAPALRTVGARLAGVETPAARAEALAPLVEDFVAAVAGRAARVPDDCDPSHHLARLAPGHDAAPEAAPDGGPAAPARTPETPAEWPFATLTDAARATRRGEIGARELTEICLRRIEALAARLNCFVRVDAEGALARARALDDERARGGPRGPLHGIPLAHKDCLFRAGRPSTCGSALRLEGFVPETTAAALERLDAAGAIDLGTLHLTEWAIGPTGHNAHLGPCRNPWSEEHCPGGSSSGSGAAVAARLVFGALGTDTGGSVRLPAAMCGLVGLRPTLGRVSRHGLMAQSPSLETIGPLARTARDAARLLGVVAGHDPRDPLSRAVPVPDYEAALGVTLAGTRLGWPGEAWREGLDPEVADRLESARAALEGAGAKTVPVTLPPLGLLERLGKLVMAAEVAAVHARRVRARPEAYGEQVLRRIEPGFHVPAVRYLEALQVRDQVLGEVLGAALREAEALVLPVLPFPVPTLAATDVGGGEAMVEVVGGIIRRTVSVAYLGLPAVAVPCGFTRDGLPVAFQIVGRPFAEGRLLALAHAYDRVTGWTGQVPPLARADLSDRGG